MSGKSTAAWRPAPRTALLLPFWLLTGCALLTGSPGRTSQAHRLLDSAKQMRQAMVEPMPLPRELNKTVLPPYVVEPGDVLLVQSADPDSPVHLPADQPILPDGTINLGRYGRIVVAGRTVDEIETMVRSAVAAQTKDAGPIVVRLVTRQSKVYYVLGDVNSPGAFPLAGRETVLDGIVAAGGLTDRASRDNIILSRPTPPDSCRVVLPICYRQIVQLGDTSTNYQLMPGDRIFVPSRTLRENLCPDRQEHQCGPCSGPQVPCTDAEHCAGRGTAPPPVIGAARHVPPANLPQTADPRPALPTPNGG